MPPLPNATLELAGEAFDFNGAQIFLLADAVAARGWAGASNPTSADDDEVAGSDWHRVLLASEIPEHPDGACCVEVDLGDGRVGLGVTQGISGWHTVFRTAAGLLLVTGGYADEGTSDYPVADGTTARLPDSPAFWDFLASPLGAGGVGARRGGAVHAPSGWLVIMSTVASAREVGRDGAPADLSVLCREAERSDRSGVAAPDGLGGQALLLRVGTAPMAVWFEPEQRHDDFGSAWRCEVRFESEPATP